MNAFYYNLFRIGIIFMYISSMYAWFTWKISISTVTIISIIFVLPFFISYNSKFENLGKDRLIFILFVIFELWIYRNTLSFLSILHSIVLILLIYILITLNLKLKNNIIDDLTKFFGIILLPSIVLFLLYRVGFAFPHNTIFFGDSPRPYDNYLFFVARDSPRFYGYFLEPGYLTLGIAPLLLMNKFNLRNKYVLILFIAQMLSLSLAGYIVCCLGFIFLGMQNVDFFEKMKLLVGIFVTFLLFLIAINSLFKNDLFQTMIIDRLYEDDIATSRYSDYINVYFERFLDSDDKWTGIDFKSLGETGGNAGYKVYTLQRGLIGLFIAFGCYCIPFCIHKTRNFLFMSIFLLMLLFQNAYPNLWCMVISGLWGGYYLEYNDRLKY